MMRKSAVGHFRRNMRRSWLALLCGSAAVLLLPGPVGGEESVVPDALRAAALRGEVEAQLRLGSEFFHGVNRPRNPELAVYWFRKAAAGGSAEAHYNLGICLEGGIGAIPSRLKAYREYETAAAAGVVPAKFRRAMLLLTGIPPETEQSTVLPGVNADPEKARSLLRELATAGYMPAKRELAALTLDRKAEERRPEELREAIVLLEEAVEAGDAGAMRLLADCCYGGIGMAPDHPRMASLLRRAAEAGDPEAAGKLAYCYENGIGVKTDEKEAFRWLGIAAESGLPMALAKLGEYYWNGRLVPQNVPKAIELYRAAAERENG